MADPSQPSPGNGQQKSCSTCPQPTYAKLLAGTPAKCDCDKQAKMPDYVREEPQKARRPRHKRPKSIDHEHPPLVASPSSLLREPSVELLDRLAEGRQPMPPALAQGLEDPGFMPPKVRRLSPVNSTFWELGIVYQ